MPVQARSRFRSVRQSIIVALLGIIGGFIPAAITMMIIHQLAGPDAAMPWGILAFMGGICLVGTVFSGLIATARLTR
jgi:hypothetical protein